MNRTMIVGTILVALAAMLSAEDVTSPRNFKSDVNFDNGCVWKIKGTQVTVSAAEINASGQQTTGAVTAASIAITGAATVTGKTTANGELEANDIVDINMSDTNDLMTIDQTNTVGKADVPLISITDARTGANANTAGEATLVITPSGTHAISVTAGITALQAVEGTSVTGTGRGTFASVASTGQCSIASITNAALAVSGTLGVTGVSTLSSDAKVGGNATITGTLTATGAVTAVANLSVGTTLKASGATTLGSTLSVTGAVTFVDTLSVTGVATFVSTPVFNAALGANGTVVAIPCFTNLPSGSTTNAVWIKISNGTTTYVVPAFAQP